MEHDIERLLRKKIITAEQNKVQWNEKEVWQKIDTSLAPAFLSQPKLLYYAAASLFIVMGFGIYFFTQQNIDRQAFLKIQSLNMSLTNIEKGKLLNTDIIDGNCGSEEINEPLLTQIKNKKHIKSASKKNDQLAHFEANKESIADAIEDAPKDSTLNISKNILPEIKVGKNLIQPVIGVFIPEEEPVQIVHVKKIKFKLFRPSERFSEKHYTDSKIIFARIN